MLNCGYLNNADWGIEEPMKIYLSSYATFHSVVLNLIVVTAIKEKENSLDVFNVLLANLCLSNLTRWDSKLDGRVGSNVSDVGQ